MGKTSSNQNDKTKELYLLIDKIPEKDLAKVKLYLNSIINQTTQERFVQMHQNAPIDDEPLTMEDIKDIEKGKAEIERGESISLSDYIKKRKSK